MKKREVVYSPAFILRDMILTQELSSEELTEIFIERIKKINPIINAYCTPAYTLARKMALDADKKVQKGIDIGSLNGIPVSIKDLNPVAGLRMTMGSKIYENYISERDSISVKRLKKEGCVILGKTNTPEFGLKGVCDNRIFGASKNPWDFTKTTGGSSGGAAAAVASGLCPIAQGSDGGGSIRHPSSFCGVYGIKPSFGRVPIYPRKFIMAQTLSVIGPISRYVKDAALMLDAMKGNYNGDRYSLPDENISYFENIEKVPKGLKIGLFTRFSYTQLIDSEVEKEVINSAKLFQKVGWKVEETKIRLKNPESTFFKLWNSQLAYDLQSKLRNWRDHMDPTIVSLIDSGLKLKMMDIMKAYDERNKIFKKFFRLLNKFDIIITPTTAIPAFELNKLFPSNIDGIDVVPYQEGMEISPNQSDRVISPLAWMPFTFPINMIGLPAASVPCGFTKLGLPVGMQIIANKFEDLKVLQVSKVFEDLKSWHSIIPVF